MVKPRAAAQDGTGMCTHPATGQTSAPRPPSLLLPPPLFKHLQGITTPSSPLQKYLKTGILQGQDPALHYTGINTVRFPALLLGPSRSRHISAKHPPNEAVQGHRDPLTKCGVQDQPPPAHCLLPQPIIASDFSSSPRVPYSLRCKNQVPEP